MLNIIKWELGKLFRQKKTYIGLIIIVGLIVLFGLSFNLLQQIEYSTPGQESLQSPLYSIHPLSFVLTMISSVSILVILFMILALAEMFAGEYNGGTLKMTLLCPVKRQTVFWGKMIAVWIFVMMMLVVTVFAAAAVGYIFLDTDSPLQLFINTGGMTVEVSSVAGDITQLPGMTVKTFEGPAEVLLSIIPFLLLCSLPIMAFATIVAIVAVLLNSAAVVNIVALSLHLLVLDLLATLLKWEEYILSATHFSLPGLIMYSDKPLSELATPLIVLAAYLVVCTAVGTWLFKRKQVLI